MLALLAAAALPIVQAQPEDAGERIDQAMEHLSQRISRTVTRQTAFWTWQELLYNDTGLGCPAPDVAYVTGPTRAYQIIITVDGVDYDYRVTLDGAILVLCGPDGQPTDRSDEGALAPLPTGEADLPAAEWYTWIYLDGNDLLYLVSAGGLQAVAKRPELADEALPRNVSLAISRDGSYLVQRIEIAGGQQRGLIYDFLTGNQTTFVPPPGMEISLGAGSSQIFDATSSYAVLAFQDLDVGMSEWSLARVDLATGAITAQATRQDIQAIITGADAWLLDALGNVNGTFFPWVTHVDDDGGIHVQLILAFAGGALEYSAFVWYPDADSAAPSPYTFYGADIRLDDGMALLAYFDPALPALPYEGMGDPNNAIAQGIPQNGAMIQERIYANGNFIHYSPRWAHDGTQIAFTTEDAAESRRFGLYDLIGGGFAFLPDDVTAIAGVSGGVLGLSEVIVSGFDLTHYDITLTADAIWTGPPRVGEPAFVWVQPFGVDFGLDAITLNDWVRLPLAGEIGVRPQEIAPLPPAEQEAIPLPERPAGIVHCPGTPSSLMSLGVRGQVTIIDGTTLNLRADATTASAIVRVLPEGEFFQVMGGPRCADGFTWWQIQLADGTVGWAAEGDQNRYYIEPLR
jgi:hypothetical protein